MSEIVSMSSGPQGTATSSEAFSEPSSPEFGHETPYEASLDEPKSDGADVPRGTNGNEQNGDDGKPKSAAQRKQLTKYERTKQQRIAFNKRQEALAQREAEFARKQVEFEESKKPKRDYDIPTLRKYRNQWKQEGENTFDDNIRANREELVRQADAEIAAMEAEEKASKTVLELPRYGTKEHRQMWEQAEAELRQQDSDFMKAGSRLDTKLVEIMNGPHGKAYRDHAQGIYAAYDRAKREILEEDIKSLRTKNSQYEQELKRYGGLTSIGGGVPGRIGTGGVISKDDFARLSSSEMRKHLTARAKASKNDGWL